MIAVLFGADKLLGLLRQVIIGREFGVGAQLDAFNAANNLPDLLFALISGGALAIAFIPVLSEALAHEGRSAMWAIFSRVANWAFLLTGGLAVVIAAFAGPIVRSQLGVAPGFTPQLQALVVDLMRLNLIATLIFSLSGLVMAGLQANQHFVLPALAPMLYTLGQIFGALVLAPERGLRVAGVSLPAAGLGIHGVVYGVILGAALHLTVQLPGLIRYGFRWMPRLGLDDPGLRKVARLLGPRILTIGAFHLVFVIQDNLGSRLAVGTVTALTYGWLIMQVPETIIGTALGTAILPTLAEHFSAGDDRAFEASVARAVRVLVALTLPAAVLLMVTIRPFVQAAFHFDPHGTDLVVWAARAYLVGLVGNSLLEVASRSFYARQNARMPLLASALSTTLFVALGILLYRPLQVAGIGLSNSLAFTFEALFLLALLSRRLRGVLPRGRSPARAALAAGVAGLASFAALRGLPLHPLVAASGALVVGGAFTLLVIRPELREIVRL
jgi:putative peptidoglycan lipid II flippase